MGGAGCKTCVYSVISVSSNCLHQLARLPSAVEVYRGWLGAIWMLPLVAGVSALRLPLAFQAHHPYRFKDPLNYSLLFRSMGQSSYGEIVVTSRRIYGSNIVHSDLNGQTLLSLDSYSSSLRRRVRTIGMSLGGTSRMAQLTEMLVQATFMVGARTHSCALAKWSSRYPSHSCMPRRIVI